MNVEVIPVSESTALARDIAYRGVILYQDRVYMRVSTSELSDESHKICLVDLYEANLIYMDKTTPVTPLHQVQSAKFSRLRQEEY